MRSRTLRIALIGLSSVLLTSTSLVGTAGAADPEGSERATTSYSPPTGALLGKPEGTGHTNKIRNTLVDMIDNAPPGAYIRAVTWSYSSVELTSRLIAAHKRGVVVRVLGAGKAEESSEWSRLKSALADSSGAASDSSWAKAVKNAARGPNVFDGEHTELHEKSWMFSTTGQAKRVVVVTSANMTDFAADGQWTDAYVWADGDLNDTDDLYTAMLDKFEEQTKDDGGANPYRVKNFSDSFSVAFSPWDSPSMADPVVDRINSLPANGLSIRIAAAAWRGPRGVAIARALVRKVNNGAKVWVLAGKPFGGDVRDILVAAGIPWADGFKNDDLYQHFKFMTARYVEGGDVKTRVWTGSENWSDESRGNDEIVIKVGAGSVHADYVDFFDTAVAAFGGFK